LLPRGDLGHRFIDRLVTVLLRGGTSSGLFKALALATLTLGTLMGGALLLLATFTFSLLLLGTLLLLPTAAFGAFLLGALPRFLTATFHTFLLRALPLGVLAFLPILIAFSGLIAIAPARAPGEPFIVIAMLGPASRAPIGLTIPALGVVVMDILTPIPATLAFAPAWGRFTIAPRRFVGVAWSVSFGLAKIALGIGVPASLVEPLVGFAVEIGRPPRFFVRLAVRLDDGIEPFANRHTGSACGVARRRARLRTETSEIPRTARFHSQIQATRGAGFARMSMLLFIN
jgi:hypothetical protein